MEYRWNPRTEIKLDVVLHYPPLGLVRATSKDMSLQGMYVQTGRIVLHKNEIVTVAFSYQGEEGKQLIKTDANVVRIGKDGAGLMFRDFLLDLPEIETNDYLKIVAN